jgi:hypothetical protein
MPLLGKPMQYVHIRTDLLSIRVRVCTRGSKLGDRIVGACNAPAGHVKSELGEGVVQWHFG